MRLEEFNYFLPPERIAKHPARPRDAGRLLVVGDSLGDGTLLDLPKYLKAGDLLVVNNVRVLAGRLTGHLDTQAVEITLLEQDKDPAVWAALAKPRKIFTPRAEISFAGGMMARVVPPNEVSEPQETKGASQLFLAFAWQEKRALSASAFAAWLESYGDMPLPPYLKRAAASADRQDYQTLFSAGHEPRAAAAPTAGLHFSARLLGALEASGVERVELTLEVGAGTFLPVRSEDPRQHKIHPERGQIAPQVAEKINQTRHAGGRIVAVGTTSVRLLESATKPTAHGRLETQPFDGVCTNYILPGTEILSADLMLTNFHLPRSTLLMLVCAFSGQERILHAYRHAVAAGYRFFSYGDACLLYRSNYRST